jgi:FMN phosphatase YigB (HAD superfamily)
MIKIKLLRIWFLLFIAMRASCLKPSHVLPAEQIEIGCDLHGVIVHTDMSQVWFWIKDIFATSNQKVWLWLNIVPIMARFSYLVFNKISTHEMLIDDLIAHFPVLADHRDQLLEASTSYIFDMQVLAQLEQLKAAGYHLTLASNIGPAGLEKTRAKYPIFALFDSFMTPYATSDHIYVSKPDEGFFIQWVVKAQKERPFLKKIIFIDDQKRNIEGSRKANGVLASLGNTCRFEPILFQAGAYLKEDLRKALAIS